MDQVPVISATQGTVQPQSQPVSPLQVVPQQPNKGGSWSKKILVGLLIVFVLGGIALIMFYFVPGFMNRDSASSQKEIVQEETTAEIVPPTENLFALLPGSDANVIIRYRPTPEAIAVSEKIIDQLTQYATEKGGIDVSKNVKTSDLELIKKIEEFIIVTKVEASGVNALGNAKVLKDKASAIALALKVKPEVRDEVFAKVQSRGDSGLTFQTHAADAIVAQSEEKLSGELKNNTLTAAVTARTDNLVFAISPRSTAVAKNEEASAESRLVEGAHVVLASASFKNEEGVSSLYFTLNAIMEEVVNASEIASALQPRLAQLKNLLPEELQDYVRTSLKNDGAEIVVEVRVKKPEEFLEKIHLAAKESAKKKAEEVQKIFEEEERKLKEVEAKAKGKVPRKK